MIDLVSQNYEFYSESADKEQRFILHFFPLQSIVNNASSINESKTSEFKVYSAGKYVYIGSDENINDGIIRIYDINGKEVLQTKFMSNSTNKILVDRSKGIYLVTIEHNGTTFSNKVFIE